jgi:hypothetical protein
MATAMPENRLTETMIPNATKPPTTPPTIAAMLEWLSKGTKGVSVYRTIHDYVQNYVKLCNSCVCIKDL